ncbi:hypothetical protein AAFF_G00070510 [Aldrovandia affinis]|uniref:C19orf38 Ig domain-containing protein n=1 Tax=Aldrovandia affinis TaxID=143900 RepID=A0AAD7WDB3_9TELE|nr:hypothetical protein AAFF_G00070510 [Aldrovandia affinis]
MQPVHFNHPFTFPAPPVSLLIPADLMKPNISVFTTHSETLIHCEAPSIITGASFSLYHDRSENLIENTQAGEGERSVTFTAPQSSDSTLKYCCRYQFKMILSEQSDCAGVKEHELLTPRVVNVVLAVCIILVGVTAACLLWRLKKSGSNRLPATLINDTMNTTVPNEGATNNATSPDVTYSTVTPLALHSPAFQPQQETVVYSTLKTD